MTNRSAVIGLVVLIVIMAGVLYVVHPASAPTALLPAHAQDEAAVRSTVTNFGMVLKNVSLLAPDAAQQIANTYAPYATPELIETWVASTTSAPGRLTSSPWPDHINIVSVTIQADGSYLVAGNIIEVTSADQQPGAASDSQPVEITLQERNGTWLISPWSLQPFLQD